MSADIWFSLIYIITSTQYTDFRKSMSFLITRLIIWYARGLSHSTSSFSRGVLSYSVPVSPHLVFTTLSVCPRVIMAILPVRLSHSTSSSSRGIDHVTSSSWHGVAHTTYLYYIVRAWFWPYYKFVRSLFGHTVSHWSYALGWHWKYTNNNRNCAFFSKM